MISRLRTFLIPLALGASVCASASGPTLDEPVAVFVASNIKLSVANALNSLRASGIEIDSAHVRQLIIEQLALPYDESAHNRANMAIDSAMTAHAAAENQQFLTKAAARPGARTMQDGLVFETIINGVGEYPTPESTVSFRYTAILPDGSVLDTTGDGEPLTTTVNQLCKGVTQGLLMMQAGGRYRITFPGDLGYGKNGIPGSVPPDCALQFDIELLEIITEKE